MISPKQSLIFLSLALFSSFIFFSYLVAKETFVQFDFETTVKIQDRLSSRMIEPFSAISMIGSVEVTAVICLVIIGFLAFKKHYLAALSIFLLPFGLVLEIFGKLFVYHPGPPIFMHRTEVPFSLPSFYVHTDYSYPSGHTLRLTFIAVVMLMILLRQKPTLLTWILTALIIGFIILVAVSRIYLGEHWSTDVIGGLLLGTSLAIITGICLPTPRLKTKD